MIKEELLDSLTKTEDGNELTVEKSVRNTKEPEEAIEIIKRCQKIQNKKIINIIGKQGQLLRPVKELNRFLDNVSLIRLKIYLNIRLYKFYARYPVFRKLTLTSNYFKTHFNLTQKYLS